MNGQWRVELKETGPRRNPHTAAIRQRVYHRIMKWEPKNDNLYRSNNNFVSLLHQYVLIEVWLNFESIGVFCVFCWRGGGDLKVKLEYDNILIIQSTHQYVHQQTWLHRMAIICPQTKVCELFYCRSWISLYWILKTDRYHFSTRQIFTPKSIVNILILRISLPILFIVRNLRKLNLKIDLIVSTNLQFNANRQHTFITSSSSKHIFQ